MKTVIFDMDGVIFDTERLWLQAFLSANKRFSINLSEEYRQSTCGKNETQIREELRRMDLGIDVDAYREYMTTFVHSAIENGAFEVKSGFDALISFLRTHHCKIGLATSSKRLRAEKMFQVKGYRIDSLFETAVFGDEVGMRAKPDPYMFLRAAEKLNAKPSECIVIEDSVNGIIAAKDGGFHPIMAVDLIQPDSFCKTVCDRIVTELSELIVWLEDLYETNRP